MESGDHWEGTTGWRVGGVGAAGGGRGAEESKQK